MINTNSGVQVKSQSFEFNIYRLNIIDSEVDLFDPIGTPIRGDEEIINVLDESVKYIYDKTIDNKISKLIWSLRNFIKYEPENETDGIVVGLTLARSLVSQSGKSVTETGIENSVATLSPPQAETIQLIFYMKRHIVAVENVSKLLGSETWRYAFSEIVKSAAKSSNKNSTLSLEPISPNDELLRAFRSFSKLTLLRVNLRIPNPEVTRITERIVADMENGSVRDYLQRMHNPSGLNKSETALPYASVALAQQGYKEGEVVMEGEINGKKRRIRTGRKAARAGITETKDFVRGALSIAKSKETKQALTSVLRHIDEVAPNENQ